MSPADHEAGCVLPLIDQIRILHLSKDDRIFVRVKDAPPEVMAGIQQKFAEHFPHNLVYVLANNVALSIVRPDSELADLLNSYDPECGDGTALMAAVGAIEACISIPPENGSEAQQYDGSRRAQESDGGLADA